MDGPKWERSKECKRSKGKDEGPEVGKGKELKGKKENNG